jgi:L-asparaginase
MKKILIIDTGGTFNKVYNPISGILEIDKNANASKNIARKWLCDFEIQNIIGKDSLDMTNQDRLELLGTISQSKHTHIIVIHGTDTMDVSAECLTEGELEKFVVFTGAMTPYSINPLEATANLASAYGYLQALETHGIYIAMNAVLDSYDKVIKDREKGKFTL